MQYHILSVILVVSQIFTTPSFIMGADLQKPEYKEYKQEKTASPLFEISFDDETFTVSTFDNEAKNHFTYRRTDIKKQGVTVEAAGKLLLDPSGLHFNNELFHFADITDISISYERDKTSITYYTSDNKTKLRGRIRRGNIIQTEDKVEITEDEFIRGAVFTITSDIEIRGEVNKDVVTLFGSIKVLDNGVVRGDLAAIFGEIKISPEASVYGKTTSRDYKSSKRHLKQRGVTQFEIDFDDGFGYYNRVDGLAILGKATYVHRDSIIPAMWVKGGYAFESKRWRYNIGLEQAILRRKPLVVGGKLFRELATDDDWLISDDENSVDAIVATEDYRDYYEATGVQLYLKFKPWKMLETNLGYRYEESQWFPSQRNLWSIMGRDLFRQNFSTVNPIFREKGIAEIDTTNNGYLYAKITYDNRKAILIPKKSAWNAEVWFELSDSKLNSDFDYNRFRLTLIRHQYLTRKHTLIFRGIFSGSDGYLPMNKRFFMGGLGSVRGYEHKEYIGTRFWMLNSEYRFDFSEIGAYLGIFWDMGQIANDTRLSKDIEVKNSVGISYYIDKDFKISVAQRLDRSSNNTPRFYIRMTHSF